MPQLDLSGHEFKDKVLGCWIGKNCGGTLGTPIEDAWGRPEPFDVWWYPELRSGGLPNDDLEMQLVWLTALEQAGPGLTAADLARYWLDHIGYNFDEYGLSKTNLRLGLQPPVSGAYNNWFVDCMGCPIRSEVWACIAPGHPRIAAQYAYQDAICDHAGGESVYGELFNVAIQSSAFVIDDLQKLLDIGISYVPEGSATHRAIQTARDAHGEGLDWKQARERVLAATPSPIAQYSPINLGFQVIGWLYGTDFGDALCKTVNCGYDTDSSGGSIGSWLGIRAGMEGLPQKWIEPFGLGLSTNESWGGVRHLTDGSTPIPTDIVELTDKIITQAERVLGFHGIDLEAGRTEINEADLYADESITALWFASPWTITRHDPQLDIGIDYRGTAAIAPSEPRTLAVIIDNPHPDPITVDVTVRTPVGWQVEHDAVLEVDPASATTVEVVVTAPQRTMISNSNELLVTAQPRRYPRVAPVPVTLVGASAWQVASDQDQDWRDVAVDGSALPLEELMDGRDAIRMRTFLEAAEPEEVRLAVDSSVPVTASVNGSELISTTQSRKVRPSYGAGEDVNKVVALKPGFSEVVLEFSRATDGTRPEAYVYCSEPDRLRNGITHLGRTRLPWD